MSELFLLEIGCEELPASYVARALTAMPEIATKLLAAARLTHGAIRPLGTPRRLALLIEDLADAQPDLEEEVLGPPKSAAFAEDGTPKKAAEGFAKKFGVELGALRIAKTDKGEYVAATRSEKGRPTAEVLGELVPTLIREIPFAKSMRWGLGEHSFGRPIHWIVALHGERVIPCEFAGITSGRTSRGHRFLSAATFELTRASEYVDALRERHVLADIAERERVMGERLEAAVAGAGAVLVPDEFLVGENASMVEEPFVITGSFGEEFLALPEEVIVAVMRGHQRYFAARKPDGTLAPRYLAVVNTARAPEVIVLGNDRVLRARLADARFFVSEDKKTPLADRVARLDSVVFQAKLGSLGEKVSRVGDLAARTSGDARASSAAQLAKADLVTLIVGEFPELQGLMGRWYALEQGVDPDVADAIRDHYLPKGASDGVPQSALSAHLAVADRADTLVGCFGLGMTPSGSADPFALRRAALGIIRIALDGPIDVAFADVVGAAHDLYTAQDKPLASRASVLASLDEFVRARLRVHLSAEHPTDVVDACLAAWEGNSIRDLRARVVALGELRGSEVMSSLAVAFKRAWNIAKDVPEAAVDPAHFDADEERALHTRFVAMKESFERAASAGDYQAALGLVATELRGPIDLFFEKVFVMVEDEQVRDNRLRLLASIARTVTRVAHIHLLDASSST